jgi:hypothetical protein
MSTFTEPSYTKGSNTPMVISNDPDGEDMSRSYTFMIKLGQYITWFKLYIRDIMGTGTGSV